MKIVCPCGTSVSVPTSRVGRTKYCSKVCKYRYRVRPTGLSYNCTDENPGQFQHREVLTGERHPSWLGDDVGYRQLHRWVASVKIKTGRCEHCLENAPTQWANKSHEYRRDPIDWLELCRKCHGKHDSGDNWGRATARYGEAVQRS
jgi:hypothetical protein